MSVEADHPSEIAEPKRDGREPAPDDRRPAPRARTRTIIVIGIGHAGFVSDPAGTRCGSPSAQ